MLLFKVIIVFSERLVIIFYTAGVVKINIILFQITRNSFKY